MEPLVARESLLPTNDVGPINRRWATTLLVVATLGQLFIPSLMSAYSQQRPTGAKTSGDADSTGSLKYEIGPGDVLNIVVWKEPDLSGEFTVRFDGNIGVPLVGDVNAMRLSPDQLGAFLKEKLSRFVEAPQVTVSVTAVNSAQFYVLGKVGTQGAFPYTGPIRVAQALALAGGFREFAKLDKIFVIRVSSGQQTSLPVNYEELVGERRLDSNVIILPGDTIIVP